MLKQKNRLMLLYAALAITLSLVFHLLNRVFDVLHHWMHQGLTMSMYVVLDEAVYGTALNIIFVVPILFFVVALVLYRQDHEHRFVPLMNTLALTFSSISLIAGGGGMVELHFSIFMILATIAYYEQIKLVATSTVIFALQHLLGFFLFPQLVFGANSYAFGMLAVHALFLVLTSLATTRQIYLKQRVMAAIEAEKQEKDEKLQKLVATVEQLSMELENGATAMSEQSEQHVQTSQEMLISFQEVTSGLEKQSDAITVVYQELDEVKSLVQDNAQAFDKLYEHTQQTASTASQSYESLTRLTEQIAQVSEVIAHTSQAAKTFHTATGQIESAMELITRITMQTKMLALNASIEASRAGEHGRGFAVVAAEIRALADQSRAATEEIHEVLGGIIVEAQRMAEHMEIGEQGTRQTVELSQAAVSQYAEVQQANDAMQEIIDGLYSSAQKLQEKSRHMYDEMMSMSAVTEQGVASIEQLFAATKQQQTATTKIDEEIDYVAKLAHQLKQQFVEEERQ